MKMFYFIKTFFLAPLNIILLLGNLKPEKSQEKEIPCSDSKACCRTVEEFMLMFLSPE